MPRTLSNRKPLKRKSVTIFSARKPEVQMMQLLNVVGTAVAASRCGDHGAVDGVAVTELCTPPP
jgi:hypothetical protein